MIQLWLRHRPSAGGCLIALATACALSTAAPAQQRSAVEMQVAVGGKLEPLKLPPLPRKKIPTKTFGDWTQHCTSQPGVPGQKCLLSQSVFKTDKQRKQGILAITVGYLGKKDEPAMLFRVPIALGLFLPPGLKFNVPGTEPVRMVVQSCLATGCSARTPLTPDIIAAMRNSDAGTLELYTIRKQLIRMPISFKGFAAAFASLKAD